MIPRIRGKVGQAVDPPDMVGKWFFEMWLTEIGGGEGKSLGQFGPWESEQIAKTELKRAAEIACKAIEPGGDYVDMKTNEQRTWGDEH